MSLITDIKYASMLGPYVRNFKRKSGNTFNFSCPICGDSTKNRSKARGYLYVKTGRMKYKCHNCDASPPFGQFLAMIDSNLKAEYDQDSFLEFKESLPEQPKDFAPPKFMAGIHPDLVKISQLDPSHFMKQYVIDRQIPSSWHHKLFFIPHFKTWANKVRPKSFENVVERLDEPRLIIPLLSREHEVMGYQGRSMKNSIAKYITILTDENSPKIFNLDAVKINEPIQALEGPIDAMFLPNAVASAGGRIDTILPHVGITKDRTTVIYDNEPRNIHTIKKMEKSIEAGWRVCIWPSSLTFSDINKMVLDGHMSQQDIMDVITNNSYSGLEGLVELSAWRKV